MQEQDRPPRSRGVAAAIGPRLRILFATLAILSALIGANSIYLAGVTAWESSTGRSIQNYFYQYMFLGHLVLGLLMILPLGVFMAVHWGNTYRRRNRRAVRLGIVLSVLVVLLVGSGLALVRLEPFELKAPTARAVVYWLHVLSPLAVLWLYWLHRVAGTGLRWRRGLTYAGLVGAACLVLVWLHGLDPRGPRVAVTEDNERPLFPSLAQTSHGDRIAPALLMDDKYCLECHADVHAQWSQSAHRFSSFSNPVYAAAVRETREFSLAKDQNVFRARWCAGCHDPVPLFAGLFDDPHYDDVRDPTSQVGITCTACHAISEIGSTRGNADYVIEEPLHYPFTYSENAALQWLNRQLVKAKPDFHKKTFLKPLHRTSEFCSTCHKVHLPEALNDYKWVRGQNHYDTFLLSGVSGHGARSFYYPPEAKDRCADCHMPLVESGDFGAQRFTGAAGLSVHDHLFPGANTGMAHLRGRQDVVEVHQKFLEGKMRVDLFGLREGNSVDAPLVAPLRPKSPLLRRGRDYVLELVIRTLGLGHPFTQGTTDSNEVWADLTVTSGGRVIGRSGGMDERRQIDPWSHFCNTFMLDREGNRIERRNPQDIFVPLYNNQIPPGAGQTVHYTFRVPEGLSAPVKIAVKLQYRKFDNRLMEFVTRTGKPGQPNLRGGAVEERYRNDLPVTTLAADEITLPVEGVAEQPSAEESKIPAWERWNDYGIGLLLKEKSQLRQAAEAFAEVEKLGRFDGPLNLARVYYAEGRLDEAVDAVQRAAAHTDPAAPPWTLAWLSGLVNRQQGHLEAAEKNFRSVLETRTAEMIRRRLDFSLDYEIVNLLGETLFDRAKQVRGHDRATDKKQMLERAVEQFETTLRLDPENVSAHYNLSLLAAQRGDREEAERHKALYAKYKPDDNARDRAVAAARARYPAANRAAERTVIYALQRPGAPGLDPGSTLSSSDPKSPSAPQL